ncbi:adenosylcobinamide kinase /adenosylcobinamide-phosphate guanylyltransferase [Sphingomonas sp. PP-CE-3A-406]|uniref:bifunctional adenosylcobinamide kinase/adenosylcobinamide-phosphate guanylyltransferase n=1 Tax=Sphingomonas sp. PP-CE-3A-406 TaxID=2135659 RepID=UPI000EF93D2F|nr:bifunctional adenosylcobinamide kinase/adenosylcobinamide-phosphate guanylyltransferase [Sphingomonas sp. PP-CE-3A-406]RMB55134.1 adenosylcobinamide kinase /adenosylcobinamide-phosphate guanylyltransferase [Sphingomonas sp. PP-CE-3A-406]
MYSVDASFGKTLLVLGGARSGKSRHAQAMAEQAAEQAAAQAAPQAAAQAAAQGGDLVYVATAQAFDDEMVDRIVRHRADRDARWRTVEAPIALSEALADADGVASVIVVDCLTLWMTNLLLGDHDIEARTVDLLAVIARMQGRAVFVSNEVGMGIVPDNALARRFRDEAGRLHQRLAAQVDSVDMVFAGLVQRWKGVSPAQSFHR